MNFVFLEFFFLVYGCKIFLYVEVIRDFSKMGNYIGNLNWRFELENRGLLFKKEQENT